MRHVYLFSRSDRGSVRDIEEFFKDSDRYVYFIEDIATRTWYADADDWTKDPLRAMQFPSRPKAFKFAMNAGLDRFEITEHEFVD